MKLRANREGFTIFNLTHWVRGRGMQVDAEETEATFVSVLHKTEEDLWKEVESKQRNCVRKGEKSGVECVVCKGEDSRYAIVPYNEKTLRPFLRWASATPKSLSD